MSTPRILACLGILALSSYLQAQAPPPTAYAIAQTVAGADPGSLMTIYRSGSHALSDMYYPAASGTPARHVYTFYDLTTHTSHTWDPSIKPPSCGAGAFSGPADWGDPFETTTELTAGIAKGELKPAGNETLSGIPTKVYTGSSQGTDIKVWLDEKDGLVIRATVGAPGAAMLTMVNIVHVSFAPPAPTLFTLPAYCAPYKAPPTPAELMAAETGDNGANWVNAIYGPGSKNSCSILVHVVAAKTMAPLNRKFQAGIDTTYNQDDPTPPHYVFGVGEDGTSTYAGGGLHEITNQIRNYTIRIDNPPAYFNFGINIPTPHRGASVGLIYRQCFAPVTNLYYVIKDRANPADGGDWLYAKAGKYATTPPH